MDTKEIDKRLKKIRKRLDKAEEDFETIIKTPTREEILHTLKVLEEDMADIQEAMGEVSP